MCFSAPEGPPVNTPSYSLDQSHTAVQFDRGKAKDQWDETSKTRQVGQEASNVMSGSKSTPAPMTSAAGLYAPSLRM